MLQLHGRLNYAHPEMPAYTGIIPEINKYDGGFFGVHERQSHSMDALVRIFQEKAVEAILDAGLNPSELEGTRTGVYVAAYSTEYEKQLYNSRSSQNFAITGSETSMIAHRVSYFLKLKGPSTVLDTGCSSSSYALENAYRAMRLGEIDNAIVGGAQSCLNVSLSMQLLRLGALSKDDACRPFDSEASGYVRSEAVSAVFLQRSNQAKRVYAQIVHVKTNCDGYKEEGITYPSGASQAKLLTEVHQESGVDCTNLGFVEIHGTATKAGDLEECAAIDQAVATGRKKPILVGSVKSNIGHPEVASGLCSLVKCILTLETGYIPANINFKTPKDNLTGLVQGRIKVVVETTTLEDNTLIGIKNLGIGGSNVYLLLKGNQKQKVTCNDNIPRLVCVSGRTQQAITVLFDQILSKNIDVEYIKLLHEVFKKDIRNNIFRGYKIVSKSGDLAKSLTLCSEKEKPLYFAFGELDNWYEVGKELMIFPSFSDSIQRCRKILMSKGIDIANIFLKDKIPERDYIPIVGVIAVQIAVVDMLNLLDVKATKAVGYSCGELISAYYNKILSLNEIINFAFIMDKVMSNTKKLDENITDTKGRNLNYFKKILKYKRTTKPNREALLQKLTKELLLSTNDFIKIVHVLNTLTRSEHPDEWELNSVILKVGRDNLEHIDDVSIISLFETGSQNHLESFLVGIGSLYLHGNNPQISKLYPQIDFPVGRNTPMISPSISWKHNRDKYIPQYTLDKINEAKQGTVEHFIDSTNDKWKFITGHFFNGGGNFFPAAGYLYIVWETFATMNKLNLKDSRVCLEDIKFIKTTSIPANGSIVLRVSINFHGKFDVFEGDSKLASGNIKCLPDNEMERYNFDDSLLNKPQYQLNKKDAYKELCLRGYNFSGKFQAIEEFNSNGGYVKWEENWITFMDGMLQIQYLHLYTRALFVPTFISKVDISADAHYKFIKDMFYNTKTSAVLPVYSDVVTGRIKSVGVNLSGIIISSLPMMRMSDAPILQRYGFVPNIAEVDINESVTINLEIILENTLHYKIKAVELIDDFTNRDSDLLCPIVVLFAKQEPLIQMSVKILSSRNFNVDIKVEDKSLETQKDCSLVIAAKILNRPDTLKKALAALKDNGFIISRESPDFDINNINRPDMVILTVHRTTSETILLLQKQHQQKWPKYIKIDASDDFNWLSKVQNALKIDSTLDLILYSEKEPTSGILGLVNCVRTEPEGRNVRCVFLMDDAAEFDPNDPIFSEQLTKNMAVNIYKNGQWGTYRHLPLNEILSLERGYSLCGEVVSLKHTAGPYLPQTFPQIEGELVNVAYCSLNIRDVMISSGKIKHNFKVQSELEHNFFLGLEFSGKDTRGNRVMGITWKGALSRLILANPLFTYVVPNKWTLEEAATVPFTYTTAICALIICRNIKKGDSILINLGHEGISQAAIQLALYYGCEVFIKVNLQTQAAVLKKMFPQLKDKNIGWSDDEAFQMMIQKETKGKGVDIILNPSMDKFVVPITCLARGGRVLEIAQLDKDNDNTFNLQLLKNDISFHRILMENIANGSQAVITEVKKVFEDLLLKGVIKPLNRIIFKYNEVKEAMEFVASGLHMEKALININKLKNTSPQLSLTRYYCHPQSVYIIAGGLGGFGLELANWLILRGARKIMLCSRRGITTGYQNYRIRLWESYGVIVKISKARFETREGCKQLIQEAQHFGSIAAVFNLAMVLLDSSFENQTLESFTVAFKPKAVAAQHLDDLTRKMCPDLEDFVVFSSVCCGRGNVDQTNYGMANSVMEKICELRRQNGYAALAIQWAAVGQVGMVADIQENYLQKIEVRGTAQQPISSCLEALDILLKQRDASTVSSLVLAKKEVSYQGEIVGAILNVIGVRDSKYINHNLTLAELGMDSVLAVQVTHILETEFEICLSTKQIRTMTLRRLQKIQNDKGIPTEIATDDIDLN